MSTLEIILALFTQLSLLVTCTFLFGVIKPIFKASNTRLLAVIEGCLFGLFAIGVMLNPIRAADGVIFDLRTIIVAVAGAFAGVVPAAIVTILVLIYRLSLGGTGAPLAVVTALTSLTLGLCLYYYRKTRVVHLNRGLIGLGLALAVQTLAWSLLLPAATSQQVFAAIAVPILLVFPVSSWLFGFLLFYQERQIELEAALNAERNMLRTLIDNVPDYIFIKDRTKRYILSNLAHARAAGVATPDELLARPASTFFPAEYVAQHDTDDNTVLSGESIIAQERQTVDADGTSIWVSTTKVPLRDARGWISGIVGISRDITARKEAEEALQRERNLLRTLFDAVPANVYVKDALGRFVDANSETVRKLGIESTSDLIGKTDFDFFDADLAAKYTTDDQVVLRTGQPLLNVEEPTVDHQTGQNLWFLTTKAPLHNSQGEVIGLVGVGLDITERKQAEEALRESEKRHSIVSELISDYACAYHYLSDDNDDDAQMEWVIGAFEDISGHSAEAAPSRFSLSQPVHPDDLPLFRERQRKLRSGQVDVSEFRIINRQGIVHWVIAHGLPEWDAERQKVTRVYIAVQDISERKRAENIVQAKAEDEHRLQTALTALYEITIELTQIDQLEVFYRRVVELARERLGFDRFGLLLYDADRSRVIGTYGTDASGQVIDERHLSFDPETLTGILQRSLDTADHFSFDDHAQLFSNLEPIGFGWNAAAVLWNGRQTLGWLATDNGIRHQPVTQLLLDILVLYAQTVGTLLGRKRAEAALRDNEAKLQTFFQVLPVGVSVLDANGKIIEMNPALERIMTMTLDGLLSGAYRSRTYIADDGKPLTIAELPSTRARREQKAIHDEVIGIVKEDGSTVWTSVSAAPLPAAQGGVIVVTADITERRSAESQAFALAAEQQRVTLLRQFISDVSHDFRTPLTLIGTSAFLISKTTDPARLARFSQRIEDQIARLGLLLDNFVEIARLEQQVSSLQFQPTDLVELLRAIVEQYSPAAAAKRQQLDIRLEMEAAFVLGDEAALTKAITHVLANAILYTPDEGRIGLRLYRHGEEAVIEVTDSGIGIPAEDLPHVFESFYRVDSARSTDSGGAGLGLSVAHKIVELLKGRIEAESEYGAGSVFRIVLPIRP